MEAEDEDEEDEEEVEVEKEVEVATLVVGCVFRSSPARRDERRGSVDRSIQSFDEAMAAQILGVGFDSSPVHMF